ncbi:ribosomal large subunit pseudouridine synthase D [bacterium BMS3Bbin02]|nr:ribosomal large subunit pseudouridine synthase D [bacterium BMS3Bbin02]
MTAERSEVTLRVADSDAGSRFDKLVASLASVSRAAAATLVVDGEATLNSRTAKGNTRVEVGDRVTVRIPVSVGLMPVPMPIEIAYRDNEVLVVNKAPGRVVHPGAGHDNDTLVNGLVYQYEELSGLGEERRWGLVHRLDKDTSGLLMVARTAEAFDGLRNQLNAREIERVYTALVHGSLQTSTGTVDAPIVRDPHQPTKMAVGQGGRFARTHFQAIERWRDHDLLRVTLETGRTHQIRVHLQSIGHPLVGDPVYGDRLTSIADPGRVWLHATNLRFRHPITDREIRVAASLPRDLVESLEALRTS